MKGLITKIDITEGMNDKTKKAWKRWSYTIDNKKYSTFDIRIGEAFKVGDYVEVTMIKNGEYWNMSSMIKSSPEACNSQIEPTTSRPDSDILRQILAETKENNLILSRIFCAVDAIKNNLVINNGDNEDEQG
jgi:hypothetical protein